MASTSSTERLPLVDDFDELVQLVKERKHLFVRYSKGPSQDAEGGPSLDYESDVALPGFSVTTIVPEPWWTRPAEDWIARRLCKYEELGAEQDRFPWLLTGRTVGFGPDHEPLVVDVEPVARVGLGALETAKRLYRDRFNIAEDSRSDGESTSDHIATLQRSVDQVSGQTRGRPIGDVTSRLDAALDDAGLAMDEEWVATVARMIADGRAVTVHPDTDVEKK